MSEVHNGTCLCGVSSYKITGPVKFAIQCYCTDCQHVSGGGHLPQIAIEHSHFEALGDIRSFTRTADAGSDLTFSFCGTCGAPLYKVTSKMPGMAFVYPGSLERVPDVTFETHVFEASRQFWDAP